jgi:antitoxin VapB
MALSIKTSEADRLARALAKETGESLIEAVTNALRERLHRERARRIFCDDLPARLSDMARRLRASYDARPVNQAEWDAASSDEV